MSKNQAYTFGQNLEPTSLPLMPKNLPKTVNFGQRLVALRKAAGYTQQELANEVGISRRMVAYYETESAHPPTHLLADFAQALNMTTDELLGITPTKKKTAKPGNVRLQRRLQQIEKLPPKDKRQILQILDALIEQRKTG